MSHLVAQPDNRIECVLVLADDKRLQFTPPLPVQGADDVNQALRIEVGQSPNVPLYVTHYPLIRTLPDELD